MQIDDSFFKKQKEKAKVAEFVYHFTSLQSLLLILENYSFRLSRLDILNDPAEANRVDDFWNGKVYSFSFCEGDINYDYFWNNYASIKNDGVCIVLKNFDEEDIDYIYSDSACENRIEKFNLRSDVTHKEYNSINDWCIYDILKASVLYTDNIKNYNLHYSLINNNDCKISLSPGLIKEKQGYDKNGVIQNWEKENEQRIRVAIRPKGLEKAFNQRTKMFESIKPQFEHLYFHIPSEIKKIIINPDICSENRANIKNQIKHINSNIEVE